MKHTASAVTLKLNVQQRFYELIANGKKTVEGRLAKPKYTRLNLGEKLAISDGNHVLFRYVAKVEKYPDFKTMLAKVGHRKMIPDVNTSEDALAVYHGFNGYKKQEKGKGVVAIWMVENSLDVQVNHQVGRPG